MPANNLRGRYLSMENGRNLRRPLRGRDDSWIACALDRAPSTVMRELRRNMPAAYEREPTEEQAGTQRSSLGTTVPAWLNAAADHAASRQKAGQAYRTELIRRAGSSQAEWIG